MQGFAPEVGWTELAEAAFALKRCGRRRGGIPWIATNTDWTIPQARGIAPGNGTLVSAVHTAVGRLPIVAGKPEAPIFEEAVARFGAQHPLVLGDRLDTDILGREPRGHRLRARAHGHRRAKQVLAADAGVAARLHPRRPARAARAVPGPVVERRRASGDARAARSGARGRAHRRRRRVEIVAAGDRGIDLLRAGDRGDLGLRASAIYALDVAGPVADVP